MEVRSRSVKTQEIEVKESGKLKRAETTRHSELSFADLPQYSPRKLIRMAGSMKHQ